MRALSVKQPWANWIADGSKTIETRTWSTRHRGPLLIVSSTKPDTAALLGEPAEKHGPYGFAIATATLSDCRPMKRTDEISAICPWRAGIMAWVLTDIKAIKPFPVTGRMGLYDVEVESNLLERKS